MHAKDGVSPSEDGAVGARKPLLMVDIDGVLSLFGVSIGRHNGARTPADSTAISADGAFHAIEGIPHFLSSTAAAHLLELAPLFELVWASGWEERADEHLPHLLGLPAGLPFLRFSRSVGRSNAHWKLDAIEAHAAGRPLAWIDDALNDECHRWAAARATPTLLVQTDPTAGLTRREVLQLRRWALQLESG